jgi:hypothetical protein
MKRFSAFAGLLALTAACGGSSPSAPVTPTPPPTPAVAISATGNGDIVVAPSKYTAWAYALKAPIRITETAGGTAKWNFARLALYNGGREVERSEIGAADLALAPDYSNITANQSLPVALIFRLNSDEFDGIDITLGFADKKDGRSFTLLVPFNTFSDVVVDMTPLANPRTQVERLP